MASDTLLQCRGVPGWKICNLKKADINASVIVAKIIVEWKTHLNEGHGVDKAQRKQ